MSCHLRRGAIAIALLAAACGGSNREAPPVPAAPTPPPLTVNGAYSGDGGGFLGIGRMRWVLSQSGSAVTGTVTATDPQGGRAADGTLSGTLNGLTLSFTIVMPPGGLHALPSCSATIQGIAEVTASTITGVFSGTATCSSSFFGPVALTKE